MVRRWIWVALVVAAMVAGDLPWVGQQALAQQAGCRGFAETGKTVGGKLLAYWQGHGGVTQQGYPISNPLVEKSALDGKEYTVQYFERAVFESHPENRPPYDILLSQLGTLQFKRRYPGGATPTPAPADAWAPLRERPLKLPALAPGSACPATGGKMVGPDFGTALGNGPVYPVGFSSDGVYYYRGAVQEGGWDEL